LVVAPLAEILAAHRKRFLSGGQRREIADHRLQDEVPAILVEELVIDDDSVEVGAGQVTFEPGSRTEWHPHSRGQT
jgi:quercetin dioxygenase-like cupin family protein